MMQSPGTPPKRSRNRNRSKRRTILCPVHHVYLDSVSQKYPLYASKPEHLQVRGFGRKRALTLVAGLGTVSIAGEWLEAFWCSHCQTTCWYHVHKIKANQYTLSVVPDDLWWQATGVILPMGNPSVSEFTRRQSKQITFAGAKDFGRIG
ncbi:hypothetical protein [Nodosilinea nodulosa]|uniref:hypothetical protein n=1 Tax=Nodosilinea nodulosa TaxID=416001 RepID=UPI0002D62939|nr:hypothetical protein [Nodosilinea nodulosa]